MVGCPRPENMQARLQNSPDRDDARQALSSVPKHLAAHNDRDLDAIKALCSPKSTHRGGPPSVQRPVRNADEYITFVGQAFKLLHTYHAEVIDAIVYTETRKVVLFMHTVATADVGEYDNEYIMTVTLTEDGKLVQDQYDFIDSQVQTQWLEKMKSFAEGIWEKK
jgi:ketosteroid isomerase-like protein